VDFQGVSGSYVTGNTLKIISFQGIIDIIYIYTPLF